MASWLKGIADKVTGAVGGNGSTSDWLARLLGIQQNYGIKQFGNEPPYNPADKSIPTGRFVDGREILKRFYLGNEYGSTSAAGMSLFSSGFEDPTHLTFKVEFGEWGGSISDIATLRGIQASQFNTNTYYMDYDQFPMGLLDLNFQTTDDFNSQITYNSYNYLRQRNQDRRAQYIKDFVEGIYILQKDFPYLFYKISGLQKLFETDPGYGQRIKKDTTISLECLSDGIDQKIFNLMQLYRKSAWNELYQRWELPDIMRYFKMIVYIFDNRCVQMGNGMFSPDQEDFPILALELGPCEFSLKSLTDNEYSASAFDAKNNAPTIDITVKGMRTYYANKLMNRVKYVWDMQTKSELQSADDNAMSANDNYNSNVQKNWRFQWMTRMFMMNDEYNLYSPTVATMPVTHYFSDRNDDIDGRMLMGDKFIDQELDSTWHRATVSDEAYVIHNFSDLWSAFKTILTQSTQVIRDSRQPDKYYFRNDLMHLDYSTYEYRMRQHLIRIDVERMHELFRIHIAELENQLMDFRMIIDDSHSSMDLSPLDISADHPEQDLIPLELNLGKQIELYDVSLYGDAPKDMDMNPLDLNLEKPEQKLIRVQMNLDKIIQDMTQLIPNDDKPSEDLIEIIKNLSKPDMDMNTIEMNLDKIQQTLDALIMNLHKPMMDLNEIIMNLSKIKQTLVALLMNFDKPYMNMADLLMNIDIPEQQLQNIIMNLDHIEQDLNEMVINVEKPEQKMNKLILNMETSLQSMVALILNLSRQIQDLIPIEENNEKPTQQLIELIVNLQKQRQQLIELIINNKHPHNEFIQPIMDLHKQEQQLYELIMNEEKPHNEFVQQVFDNSHPTPQNMVSQIMNDDKQSQEMTPQIMNDDKPHNEFVNPEFNDEHLLKQDMTSQLMNEEKPHNDFIHPEFNDEHYPNEDMIPIEQTTNAPNSNMTPVNTEASYVHIPMVEMNMNESLPKEDMTMIHQNTDNPDNPMTIMNPYDSLPKQQMTEIQNTSAPNMDMVHPVFNDDKMDGMLMATIEQTDANHNILMTPIDQNLGKTEQLMTPIVTNDVQQHTKMAEQIINDEIQHGDMIPMEFNEEKYTQDMTPIKPETKQNPQDMTGIIDTEVRTELYATELVEGDIPEDMKMNKIIKTEYNYELNPVELIEGRGPETQKMNEQQQTEYAPNDKMNSIEQTDVDIKMDMSSVTGDNYEVNMTMPVIEEPKDTPKMTMPSVSGKDVDVKMTMPEVSGNDYEVKMEMPELTGTESGQMNFVHPQTTDKDGLELRSPETIRNSRIIDNNAVEVTDKLRNQINMLTKIDQESLDTASLEQLVKLAQLMKDTLSDVKKQMHMVPIQHTRSKTGTRMHMPFIDTGDERSPLVNRNKMRPVDDIALDRAFHPQSRTMHKRPGEK